MRSSDELAANALERQTLVPRLTAMIGCDNGEAGGCVDGADSGFDLVAVLTPRAARPERLERDLASEFIQVDCRGHGLQQAGLSKRVGHGAVDFVDLLLLLGMKFCHITLFGRLISGCPCSSNRE